MKDYFDYEDLVSAISFLDAAEERISNSGSEEADDICDEIMSIRNKLNDARRAVSPPWGTSCSCEQ